MNVIVSNKYTAMLSSLSSRIDLIKTIDGEFQVEDLIAQFENFFFNKMILDITAISGYQDITQIQKLSFGLDMSKVILLLDDSPTVNSPEYLSYLVQMGIYNFTRDIETIVYLVDHPNTYKDVAQFHMIGSSGNNNQNMMQQNPNQGNGQFINQNMMNNTNVAPQMVGTRVIGIKNLTEHAGATSLIYMLKKQLSEFYNVLAIELDRNDFIYLNDSDLRSVSSAEFNSIVDNPANNFNVILVDVNDSPEINNCPEMLYLVEPSTIKLNKMIHTDNTILEKMRNLKLVLNKSLLDPSDIREFENEANCSVFFNIQPLDDKKDKHRVIDELLSRLGFDKNTPAVEQKNVKLFGIVKE